MRQDLTIETSDGQARAWLFRPDTPHNTATQLPGIIFYMDGLGPRDALYAMAQRLANAGYLVLLPDVFYRFGSYGPYDGNAFSDETSRQQIMAMIGGTSLEMTVRDTEAFLRVLADNGAGGTIGTVGYCMGGARALTAAARFPEQVRAAASFHGGNLASEDASSPHRLAETMQARIYVASAEVDSSFPPEQSACLAAALRRAGVDYTIENYVGMQHGWTVPDRNAIYNEEGAERHWRRLLTLFSETLAPAA
jgi:carboxymethylenebutenolidase